MHLRKDLDEIIPKPISRLVCYHTPLGFDNSGSVILPMVCYLLIGRYTVVFLYFTPVDQYTVVGITFLTDFHDGELIPIKYTLITETLFYSALPTATPRTPWARGGQGGEQMPSISGSHIHVIDANH